MKYLWHIFSLLICVTVACSTPEDPVPSYFSQEKIVDIKTARMYQQLGVRQENIYACKQHDTPTASVLRTKLFNEHGQIIEERIFDAEGNISEKIECVYDTLGNKAKINYYNQFDEIFQIDQFDPQGYNTVSVRISLEQGKKKTEVYKTDIIYNEHKYPVLISSYDAHERLISEKKFTYHTDLQVSNIQDTRYNYSTSILPPASEWMLRTSLQSDAPALQYMNQKDTLILQHTNTYNKHNQLIQEEIFNGAQRTLVKTYTYNEEQQLKKCESIYFDKLNEAFFVEEFYYTDGKVKALTYYNSEKEKIYYKSYTYRPNGLLIQEHWLNTMILPTQQEQCYVHKYANHL